MREVSRIPHAILMNLGSEGICSGFCAKKNRPCERGNGNPSAFGRVRDARGMEVVCLLTARGVPIETQVGLSPLR